MARRTDTVTISDGRVVPIRQLGWLQLRASRQAYQRDSARGLVEMGGADFMAAWKAMQADKEQERAAKIGIADDGDIVIAEGHIETRPAADPLSGHDLFTVLASGIPTWSKEQIEDLDEDDAVLLGQRIVALSPAPRTESDLGNAPAPSTAV